MSFQYSKNLQPANSAEAIFNWKQHLKSVGWIVRRSSDGTTYNSSGDQITTGSSGGGGMANAGAWFVIEQPGAVPRQFCIQVNTSGLNVNQFRCKYSYNAGFTGGLPGAQRVPSAADEQVVFGFGSDALPSFTTLFNSNASNNYYQQIGADDAAPYGFYSVGYKKAAPTGHCEHGFMLDPLVMGTYQSTDADPYIIYMSGSTITFETADFGETPGGNTAMVSFYKKGLSGEAFQGTYGMPYGIQNGSSYLNAVPVGQGVNPYNGKDDIFPIYYGRRSALAKPGVKGQSSLMSWSGSVQRNPGDSYDGKKKLSVGQVTLPWDGATTPSCATTSTDYAVNYLNFATSGASLIPTIANLTPAANTNLVDAESTAIAFDVLHLVSPIDVQTIKMQFGPNGAVETVWSGGVFQAPYAALSTQSGLVDGRHFSIQRTGGWGLVAPIMDIRVVDDQSDVADLPLVTWARVPSPTTILIARSLDEFTVDLVYQNAPPDPVAAVVPSNYAVDHGLVVLAVQQITAFQFRLTTTAQTIGLLYTITTSNI